MSIESKEINDIYALYQNLHERTYAEVKAEREERIKNIKDPFRNTTIEKEDGTKIKKGDKGFDQELEKGRKTVRDANNKTLGKDKKEYGGTGTKTVLNKDGSRTTTTGHSDDLRDDPAGTRASSEKGKKLLNPEKEKVTPPAPKLDRESGTPPNRTAPKLDRDEVKSSSSNSSSDVGSDGLSSKNKKNTTKTVNKVNSRGRVTGTKEVRVQSQQSDGGTPIRNRRGRVVGTTKPTDAEGKSFPSTAEIRAKAKADGGSGLSNIPSKEGNAVINKKPLNPDFGKKPVIQKDTAVKPEISARQKWLDKTRNSPAAKGGLSDDQRWAARQKHVKFQKDNNRGPFRDPNKKAGGRKFNPSNKITSVMDMESYDAYDLVLIHLLETNQVDTIEEANYVMTEMDGKTILEIKRLMESMPAHVRDSIGRQYGTGKYKGEKYTIEDKKNVVNWYSRIKA